MHDDGAIVRARLLRVFEERIKPAVYGERQPFVVTAWEAPGEPVSPEEAANQEYLPFEIGRRFGRPWGTTWFRFEGAVPDGWAGCEVDALIDLGFTAMPGFQSEGLVWATDAAGRWCPQRAVNPLNHAVTVARGAAGGENVSLIVEAASNPALIDNRPDPNSDLDTAGRDPIYRLAAAELAVRRPEVMALRHDVSVLAGLMGQLSIESPRHHEILRALEAMLDRLDLSDVVGTAPAARSELAEVLARPAEASAHRISAIGHAHIDSAWLWPVRETVRKCARTFSNVLSLMDSDPDLVFGCSQAQQYEWMRTTYPSIFEGISRRVADGRWVPIGGMWVEADANLAGGEALIRQFTHGQRFFEEHFGVSSTEVWIPDVFGYPASLPQIMKVCGIDRFLTQKLSWNKTNVFPHHSFWWEGIDGSTVFTHFPPVETYNATFRANELSRAVRTFNDKGRATRSLMPFGHGDGGGGPTPDMMEKFRRVRDLEGSPRIEIESPEAFFDAAIAEYSDAPRWVGELYFEMHRGTFTSQARTKWGNRRCEILLREAELWCVAAYGAGERYPTAQLDALWKRVLLLQFHDILPGSSIGWVHREAEATHLEVIAELEAIIAGALESLSAAEPADRSVVLANPSPHQIAGVVLLDGPLVGAAADEVASTGGHSQLVSDGRVALWAEVPAGAVTPVGSASSAMLPAPVQATASGLDNGLVRVELDERGLMVSICDLAAERELVAPGQAANRLQLHQDLPNEYDAWDIEEFYRRRMVNLDEVDDIVVLDEGPLVGRVRVRRTFGNSTISQVIELRTGSPRIDVVTEVDWHERERLLKASFPLDLQTAEATREIQFGHLRTAIHTNTSWDAARFEVCAHRWVDVSEPDYGVALLNDCKYGYDISRTEPDPVDGRRSVDRPFTTLRLTLLRGPRYPDPQADQGTHRFTYSLLPHVGDLRVGGVIPAASHLNSGVRLVVGSATPPSVSADHDSVVVEAVKAADDGSGDVVVRCYESWGTRASATLTWGFDSVAVAAVDARERTGIEPSSVGLEVLDRRTARLSLRPFQIATLRITPD